MSCCHMFLFCFTLFCHFMISVSWISGMEFDQDKNYEGSSDLVDLEYHMGPVLSSSVNLYIIWYGKWNSAAQSTIRDFIGSISSPTVPHPSVSDWWKTVRLYRDQTGSNITENIFLSGEFHDHRYSHGAYLTRLDVQSIIKSAITSNLPLNSHNGLYLILTSEDVRMQDFCRAVCGFHYFTFSNIVGATLPYAWVGASGVRCPGMCGYPTNNGLPAMKPPNGEASLDGMISIIAHELAEVSSNPLVNAWYAGDDPTAPTEIADLCQGVYGSGGGGGYMGRVYRDRWGVGYNLNGVKGRKFLVQWVWDPIKKRCFGPNAVD